MPRALYHNRMNDAEKKYLLGLGFTQEQVAIVDDMCPFFHRRGYVTRDNAIARAKGERRSVRVNGKVLSRKVKRGKA